MEIFDILGPVMIGPSSSHTAGAVRMGNLASNLLNDRIVSAEIVLHGSFAMTAKGHGTDRAIIGGLLGFAPDDERIRDSFIHAEKRGLVYKFEASDLGSVHPNTALIRASGEKGRSIAVLLSSIGGGKIILSEIDGVMVRFEGKYPTLVIFNEDVPGVVVSVSSLIANQKINIVEMRVYQSEDNRNSVMIVNLDKPVDDNFLQNCRSVPEIEKIIYLDRLY